jgi:hypothetical protein
MASAYKEPVQSARIFTAMPRYFFHIHEIGPADPVGEELTDDKAAWREATLVAAEIFRDIDGKQPGQNWRLEVTDDHQQTIYVIRIETERK